MSVSPRTSTAAQLDTNGQDWPDCSVPECSLDQLLGLVALGDPISFARLYDQTAGRVYGLVQRVLCDPAQAEEVAQEVFIEIWTKAANFNPARGAAIAWMLTIARRQAIDRVRHSQRSRERDHRHATAVYDRDHDTVHDVIMEQLDHLANTVFVNQAINELTALQQQAIRLAFYDHHTYTAISQLLGVPLGTVKTRIRDGLVKLGKHYTAITEPEMS